MRLGSVRRIKNSQVFQHESELREGNEVNCELFIACSQSSAFLERPHGALNTASFPVRLLIKSLSFWPRLIAPARNDGFNPVSIEILADGLIAITFIAGKLGRPADATWAGDAAHYCSELR